MRVKLNCEFQYYKGLPLQLIHRGDYKTKQAKRFAINGTNQNVWIPNKHLLPNGTIIEGENLDYVFAPAGKKLELAGYMMGFIPVSQPAKQRHVPPTNCERKETYPYNRTHPSFRRMEEEQINHPEINTDDDYFTHYAHQPY